jgi:dolichol kinase
LVLSISDPAAGLVGSWFTWKGLNLAWKELLPRSNAPLSEGGPSVAGSFACVAMTIMCTYLYIPSDNLTVALSLYSRICIGILTAVAEAVGGRHFPVIGSLVDDNLLIPLVVGISICWLNTQ